MSDKIATLKLIDNTDVFPNIKDENIPNTVMRIADLSKYLNQLKSIKITGDIDSATITSDIATFTTSDISTLNVSGISQFEGEATFGHNVHVGGNLVVNGIENILDKDENKIVNTGTFDPTSDNPAGQKSIYNAMIPVTMEKLGQDVQDAISGQNALIQNLEEKKEYDLSKYLVLGGFSSGVSYNFSRNRAVLPAAIRVYKSDLIIMKATGNARIEAGGLFNPDFSNYDGQIDLNLWNNAGEKQAIGFDGYIVFDARLSDNSEIDDINYLRENISIKIYSFDDKTKGMSNHIGERPYVNGNDFVNLDSISSVSSEDYVTTDYIPVISGHRYRVTCMFNSIYKNTGVIGYEKADSNGCYKTLLWNDYNGTTHLATKVITIPYNVNYIRISSFQDKSGSAEDNLIDLQNIIDLGLDEKMPDLNCYDIKEIKIEKGGFSGNKPNLTDANRLRLSKPLPIKAGSRIELADKKNFRYYVHIYDKNLNLLYDTDWTEDGVNIIKDCYICIVLGKNDNSDFTDYSAFINNLKLTLYKEPENAVVKFASLNTIGDCILILNNGITTLIDTGSASDWSKVNLFLQNNGVKKIDNVIISHYHDDHIGNFHSIFTNYDLTDCNFYLPPEPPETYASLSDAEKALIITIKTDIASINKTPYYVNQLPWKAVFIGNIMHEFFNTDHAQYYKDNVDYNNMSIVDKVTVGSIRILFTGDLMQLSEENVIKEIKDTINIVKTPHHGFTGTGENATHNTSLEFWDKLKPDLLVSSSPSSDYFNQYYIDSATFKYASVNNIKNICTGKSGDIELAIDGSSYSVNGNNYYPPVTINDWSLIKAGDK